MPGAVQIGEYRPQVSVEGGTKVVPQRSGVSLGPALEDVGAGLEHVLRSEAANYALKTTADAEQNWHEEIIKRQQNAEPGAPNFTPDLLKDYDAYAKKASKAAPNGVAAQMVNKQLLQLRTTVAQRALTFEASEATRHNADVAVQSIDTAGNEVMNDPSVYAQRLADRQALISQLNMDPGTREKLNQHARDELSKYATMGAIERDPYATMVELASGKSALPYVGALTPELRTQLLNHADSVLRARVADAQRIDTMAEKQAAKVREDTLMQGVMLGKQGGLTPEWIRKASPLLKPDDIDHLYRELAGGENAKSDIHTYSDLLPRAAGGEDVTKESTDAYTKGLLSHEDFTQLVKMSGRDMPNAYKRGVSFIKTYLQSDMMNPDPAHSTSLANALEDWDNLYAQNPKASEDEYHKIANRYVIIAADKSMLTMPVSRYFAGSRTAPDIETYKKNLQDAITSGDIDAGQAAQEALNFKNWKQANDALMQKKAAAAAKKDE